MMQKKSVSFDKDANKRKPDTFISDGLSQSRINQEYCIVSVSAIKDLFSTNVTSSSSLRSPPSPSVWDKHEIPYSKNGKIVSRQLRQRRTAEKSTESLQSRTTKVNKVVRRERHDCGNDESKDFNVIKPKKFHCQYQQQILFDNKFSYIGLLRHTSERNRLSRDEFILIQRASDQVEARVRYFGKILEDYLSQIGKGKKEPPQKSVVIKMLSTTKEKFDEMIRKQHLMPEHYSRIAYQDRVRKNICEMYRHILICNILGFIGLTSTSRPVSIDQQLRNIDKNTKRLVSEVSAEPIDNFVAVTKLRENLEGAISGIKNIDQRIFNEVRWIHSQCPFAKKNKETRSLCISLGLEITERLLVTSAFATKKRSFYAWKLDSQLRYNSWKIQEFKKCVSRNHFFSILSLLAARILKYRFRIWVLFMKKKRKEERVASCIDIQRVWRSYFFRELARMIRWVKHASKLQSISRVYLLRNHLKEKRVVNLRLQAALLVQRNARWFLAVNRFRRLAQEIKSAITLQAMIRTYQSKLILTDKQTQWKHFCLEKSTTTIQGAWRLHVAICKMNIVKEMRKATTVQSSWRRCAAKKKITFLKAVIVGQKWSRRLLAKNARAIRMFSLVVKIQCAQRFHTSKRTMQNKRKDKALHMIRTFVASFLIRKELKRIREEKAAKTMQKVMREFHFRILQLRSESACQIIQSALRIRNARGLCALRRREKLLAELIIYLDQKQMRVAAVCKLQCQSRIYLAFNYLKGLRQEKNGAIALQKQFRCFRSKQNLKHYKEAVAESHRKKAARPIYNFLFNRNQRLKVRRQKIISKQRQIASVVMQRYSRRMFAIIAKQFLRYQKLRQALLVNAASTGLQRVYRIFFARRTATLLRNNKAKQMHLFISGRRIQSCVRRWRATIIKQRRFSAVRIQKALRKAQNRKIALELFHNAKNLKKTKERNAVVTVQCWGRTIVAGLRVRKLLSQVDKMADINRKIHSEKPFPASDDNMILENRRRYESSLTSAPISDIPEMFDQLEKFMQATIKNLSTQKSVKKWTVSEEVSVRKTIEIILFMTIF